MFVWSKWGWNHFVIPRNRLIKEKRERERERERERDKQIEINKSVYYHSRASPLKNIKISKEKSRRTKIYTNSKNNTKNIWK